MARRRRQAHELERVLGANALFATAYGNVGSSIYYALGVTAVFALGLTPVVFVIAGLIFAATAATYAEGTVRFPEAGGSSSFARHAFNELVTFGAAWAQMLNYVITIAISAFFVPHYLSIFWEPLKQNPWDIVGGAVVIVLLVGAEHRRDQGGGPPQHRPRRHRLRHAGPARAARLRPDLLPDDLVDNVHLGVAPTWSHFLLAIPVAMIAYTGIETVSNLAEEARDPLRTIPRSIRLVAVAVFAIYFTLPLIALSALPVDAGRRAYDDAARPAAADGGFANDPVLGVVDNLGLARRAAVERSKSTSGSSPRRSSSSPPTPGVIGASRITYAMASYRQLPERLPPAAPAVQDALAGARPLRAASSRSSPCSRARRLPGRRCTRSARCSRSPSRTPR